MTKVWFLRRWLPQIVAILAVVCLSAGCDVDTPQEAPSPLPRSAVPTPAPVPLPPPPAIPLPPGAPASTTVMTFTSEPGDPIGRGLSRTYYLGDGFWKTTAWADRNYLSIEVVTMDTSSAYWSWALELQAPYGKQLSVGTYEEARLLGSSQFDFPKMQFIVLGQGCTRGLTGQFVISDLAWGPSNTVERLDATFERRCEGSVSILKGHTVIASNPWR